MLRVNVVVEKTHGLFPKSELVLPIARPNSGGRQQRAHSRCVPVVLVWSLVELIYASR